MWTGHLLHIQVYSPDRKIKSRERLWKQRSQSVDRPQLLNTEKELFGRIRDVVNGNMISTPSRGMGHRIGRQEELSLVKAKPEGQNRPRLRRIDLGLSRALQYQRNNSPLIEFEPRKGKPVMYQPIHLVSKLRHPNRTLLI
jgi:hypothetical protein